MQWIPRLRASASDVSTTCTSGVQPKRQWLAKRWPAHGRRAVLPPILGTLRGQQLGSAIRSIVRAGIDLVDPNRGAAPRSSFGGTPRLLAGSTRHWPQPERRWGVRRVNGCRCPFGKELPEKNGGEAGIRTLGRGLCPYNGLANRRLQPLGHLTTPQPPESGSGPARTFIISRRRAKGQPPR